MSAVQIYEGRSSAPPIIGGSASIAIPSLAASNEALELQRRLLTIAAPTPTFQLRPDREHITLAERLFDARASFKVLTSQIAMHLNDEWRNRLFAQLDSLLALEDWEAEDAPPELASFRTFLRLILLLKPEVRPGLGATADGRIVAAWTVGDSKLTIECLSGDLVRWSIAHSIEDFRERVVGETSLTRLSSVLHPYQPETWLKRANNLRTA